MSKEIKKRTEEDIQKGIDSVYEHVSFESKYNNNDYYVEADSADTKRKKIIHCSVIVLLDIIAVIIMCLNIADYESFKYVSYVVVFTGVFFLASFAAILEIISPYCLLRLDTKIRLGTDAFDEKSPSAYALLYHYFLVVILPAIMTLLLISIATTLLF